MEGSTTLLAPDTGGNDDVLALVEAPLEVELLEPEVGGDVAADEDLDLDRGNESSEVIV